MQLMLRKDVAKKKKNVYTQPHGNEVLIDMRSKFTRILIKQKILVDMQDSKKHAYRVSC